MASVTTSQLGPQPDPGMGRLPQGDIDPGMGRPQGPNLDPGMFKSGGLTASSTATPLTDLSAHFGLVNQNGNQTVYNKDTAQGYSNPDAFFKDAGVNSFNGLQFDTAYDPSAHLNNTQTAAMAEPTPDSSASGLTEFAQNYFDKANTNVSTDVAAQPVTNLNQLAQQKYADLGIEDLQKKVADSQADLEKVRVQQADNLTQRELQYQGGGTEASAHAQDALDQRGIRLDEIAKSIQLQSYQSLLSSKTDAWKEFSNVASTNQQQAISEWSTKLGLDKADLTVGVQLMAQANQEANNNKTQARQLFTAFATSIPGFYQALSPADQQAIARGETTPSMIATAGKLTQEIQVKNDIAQQNASVNMSKVFGQAVGLNNYGIKNGTQTEQAQTNDEKMSVARAKLGISIGAGGYSLTAGFDGKTLANNMAQQATSLSQVPAELRPFFQQKVNGLGQSYLTATLNKTQANEFAKKYDTYLKANSSASYQPNPVPTDPGAYDPNQVAGIIAKAVGSGMSYTDIRAKMQGLGVPLTVYKQALKSNITI